MSITHDAMSTHGFGVAEMLSLMQELSIDVPLHVVGVQPQDLSMGEGLSDPVQGAINKIEQHVQTLLSKEAI